jgi:hypothetical protein
LFVCLFLFVSVFCAAGLFVDQSHSERSDCERGDFFFRRI